MTSHASQVFCTSDLRGVDCALRQLLLTAERPHSLSPRTVGEATPRALLDWEPSRSDMLHGVAAPSSAPRPGRDRKQKNYNLRDLKPQKLWKGRGKDGRRTGQGWDKDGTGRHGTWQGRDKDGTRTGQGHRQHRAQPLAKDKDGTRTGRDGADTQAHGRTGKQKHKHTGTKTLRHTGTETHRHTNTQASRL